MRSLDQRLMLILLVIVVTISISGCDIKEVSDKLLSNKKIETTVSKSKEESTVKQQDNDKADQKTENEYDKNTKKNQDGTRFYYDQLSSSEQEEYETIYEGLINHEEEIKLKISDQDTLHKLYKAVLNDNPDIFWCDNSYKYKEQKILFSRYTFIPQYLFTEKEVQRKQEQIETAANICLSGISKQDTDYQKILYVYKYLIHQTDYDEAAVNENKIGEDQNIDSVFIKKKSVCAGYARATQYLLNKLGIFCTYLEGTVDKSADAHTWNLVMCEGDYYHVDTTWGDPVFSEDVPDNIPESAKINYNYLCCNDEQLFATHSLEENSEFEIPECTKMDWNYYVVNHQYYTEYDSQKIWSAIKNDITNKRETSVFKFASREIYDQAYDQIINDYTKDGMRLIQRLYRNGTITCYHTNNEDEGLIQIYWKY